MKLGDQCYYCSSIFDNLHRPGDHDFHKPDCPIVRGRSNLSAPPVANVTPAPKKMMLSADPDERKSMPITTGVLDYFPLAMAEVAKVSKAGNDQHNPGQPLHWAKGKSMDHADCIARHLIDRGSVDSDGMRHTAKLAWRALALLQTELQALTETT
jgi:hypothetical protein